MKEQKCAVIKITAQKTKHEFVNENIEVVSIDDNYTTLPNQLFRFIQKQLDEIRKES